MVNGTMHVLLVPDGTQSHCRPRVQGSDERRKPAGRWSRVSSNSNGSRPLPLSSVIARRFSLNTRARAPKFHPATCCAPAKKATPNRARVGYSEKKPREEEIYR
ncbi:hypothetical protein Trydic_g23688 [Trypoxylus dichotomus]